MLSEERKGQLTEVLAKEPVIHDQNQFIVYQVRSMPGYYVSLDMAHGPMTLAAELAGELRQHADMRWPKVDIFVQIVTDRRPHMGQESFIRALDEYLLYMLDLTISRVAQILSGNSSGGQRLPVDKEGLRQLHEMTNPNHITAGSRRAIIQRAQRAADANPRLRRGR